MSIARSPETTRSELTRLIPSGDFQAAMAVYEKDYLNLESKREWRIKTLAEPAFNDRPFPFINIFKYDAEFVPHLIPGEAKQLSLSLNAILSSLGMKFSGIAIKKHWAMLVRAQTEDGDESYELLSSHPDRLVAGNDCTSYSGLGLHHNNARQTQRSRVKDGAIYPSEIYDPVLHGRESRGLVIETGSDLQFAMWGQRAAEKLASSAGNLTLGQLRSLRQEIPLDPQLIQDFGRRYNVITLDSVANDGVLEQMIGQNQITSAILDRAAREGTRLDITSFLRKRCLINSHIWPD